MNQDYYTTLEVSPSASAEDIKLSYRRLAKQYHPDIHGDHRSEQMQQLNEAYAVLSTPQRRQHYDHHRQERTYRVGQVPRQGKSAAESVLVARWLKEVYQPVMRGLTHILRPFNQQLEDLAYDPYDDIYIEAFQNYLAHSQTTFDKAWQQFRSKPNPGTAARVAEYLYHALNQLHDGLDELGYFCQNYDYSHLHTGKELFAIAQEMTERAAGCVRKLQDIHH